MITTAVEIHLEGGDVLVVSVTGVVRICYTANEQPVALRIRWMCKNPGSPFTYDFTSHADMFRALERYRNTQKTNLYQIP